MKTISCFLLLLYFELVCHQGVNAENDHDVKRGMFPYMAFIYYSDPSVVDVTGQRFIRSAVLIRPDWLITTALGPSVSEDSSGFPTKTLLARAGAISIDGKFTLNEDEDEQEREIVQIVRPYNHSATQWWTTDISLMKTLMPFNMTSAVGIKTLNVKDTEGKSCSILVYARKYRNMTDEKNLMVLFVELLPPSIDNCGTHFTATTMTCASDSDENKDAVYEPDFCQGNSGGPLICDNAVVGLQTYIENNCKPPHLYQLLSAWDNFITCGIEDKCQEEHCGKICDVSYKDPPKIEVRVTTPIVQESLPEEAVALVDLVNSAESSSTLEITTVTRSNAPSTQETTYTVSTSPPTLTSTTVKEPTPEPTLLTTKSSSVSNVTQSTELSTEPSTATTQTLVWPKLTVTETTWPEDKQPSRTVDTTSTTPVESRVRSWPGEREPDDKYRADVDVDRSAIVDAQIDAATPHSKLVKSVANNNRCVIQTVIFGFTVLLCL